MIEDAFDEILAMQRALKEYVGSIDPSYAKETADFFVGFEGAFGSRHVTARTLTSRHINNLVVVEGMKYFWRNNLFSLKSCNKYKTPEKIF